MSLSPLYSSLTSDLHVSTVRDPPSEFPLTSANSSIDHHLSGQSIYTLTQFHLTIDTLMLILDWSVYHITINTSLLSLSIHHYNGFCLHIRFTPWSVFQDGSVSAAIWINVEEKNSYIKYAAKTQLTLAHPMEQSSTGMKPGCHQEFNDIPLSWFSFSWTFYIEIERRWSN
jgi:hypothetical protein